MPSPLPSLRAGMVRPMGGRLSQEQRKLAAEALENWRVLAGAFPPGAFAAAVPAEGERLPQPQQSLPHLAARHPLVQHEDDQYPEHHARGEHSA